VFCVSLAKKERISLHFDELSLSLSFSLQGLSPIACFLLLGIAFTQMIMLCSVQLSSHFVTSLSPFVRLFWISRDTHSRMSPL
jgi:hypothetical protein